MNSFVKRAWSTAMSKFINSWLEGRLEGVPRSVRSGCIQSPVVDCHGSRRNLSTYAERPEEARVDASLHALINFMADQARIDTAVISARSVAQLQGDFDHSKVILAEITDSKFHFLTAFD